MQEITLPVWGWGQRVLNREHIFFYSLEVYHFCALSCSCTDEVEKGGSLQ